MFIKILLNKELPVKNRVKNFFAYLSKRRGAKYGWDKRFKKVFELHPEYKKPITKEIEEIHKKAWSFFSKRINLNTLRVCTNISGEANPLFIPEEVFVADIEPTLNQDATAEFLTNKSFYEKWFPEGSFPKCIFHNIDGEWFNRELNPIPFSEIEKIISSINYPVVFKPNINSFGGKDVFFPTNLNELFGLVITQKNFVVQEKIDQDPFLKKFNAAGLNTIRVCLYRSIKSNKIHVLNAALRMGVGGSLDNETAGGIVTLINKNGELNGFAVDKLGSRFDIHPDSKLPFEGIIPDFKNLIILAKNIACKIFYDRLISLDICKDAEGNWKVIEINLYGQTIRFAQYAGHPFFGEFTNEVINHCKQNHWALK